MSDMSSHVLHSHQFMWMVIPGSRPGPRRRHAARRPPSPAPSAVHGWALGSGTWLPPRSPCSTQRRNLAALTIFCDWCVSLDIQWRLLSAEEQDWATAEFDVYLCDEPAPVTVLRDAIAGIQRMYPGRRYATSSHVVSSWGSQTPPARAPPLSARLLYAAVTLLAASGRWPWPFCRPRTRNVSATKR